MPLEACSIKMLFQFMSCDMNAVATGDRFEEWNEHMVVDKATYQAYLAGHGCVQQD